LTPVTALLRRALRSLARCWPLWFLPPLVALAGRAMLPVNAEAYMTYVYFDLQGPQQLEAYHFDVKAVHTSGLGWAQLAAVAVGAFMVLRDPRLTSRSPAPSPPADPGPYLVAKAGAAALFGVVLAVVDLAVALPLAARQVADHWVRRELAWHGIVVPEQTLADGAVWPVVLCGVASCALFAVVGIGLAALFGRWWAMVVAAVVSACGSLAFWNAALSAPTPPALAVSLALKLGAAAFIFLLGYGAARGRLVRASAVAARRRSLRCKPASR
jgi:hypothetical protein